MSRYTGPRVRVMRALGTELPGLSPKKIERRPYPPGQNGQGRRKISEYGRRLMEKQKLRMNYGLSERQLRRLVDESKRAKGATGSKLVEFLERRLDNVVFRAGLARSIPEARQIVNHGHILVDGRAVNIPSFRTKQGQVLTIKERSKEHPAIVRALQSQPPFQTPWLDLDRNTKTVRVSQTPDEGSVLFPLQVQLVVEYYSQRL